MAGKCGPWAVLSVAGALIPTTRQPTVRGVEYCWPESWNLWPSRSGAVCLAYEKGSLTTIDEDDEADDVGKSAFERKEEDDVDYDDPLYDLERRIFCNRELNMQQIKAVGFDMDYTLAQYTVEFDLLAFDGAKDKLIGMGYPAAVVSRFEFDPSTHVRGLVIDKARGNILKVDRHKYCRRAFHGTRELTAEERKRAYIGVADETPTFTGDDFVNVDSLFQVIDAALYAPLVDAIEAAVAGEDNLSAEDRAFLATRPYREAYKNVRHAVDLCHHDGVIKDRVAEDPGRYILPDEDLVPMLENFRRAGKKVFCLTNSLFDYTNVVMNFLVGSMNAADGRDWLNLFDLVIVGAGKPAFISPDSRQREMLRVDVSTNRGTLHNLAGAPVFDIGATAFLQREGKVFQGGGYRELHAMLSLESGSQLLYVGDHIYSDVLRSKRSLGWRTALIIPELEAELHVALAHAQRGRDVERRIREFEAAEDVADDLRLALLQRDDLNDETARLQIALLAEAEARRTQAREASRLASEELHAEYHPTWGPLFRAGQMASRFAKQVVDYACIYTSKASNLIRSSPYRHFRPHSDSLPHDHVGA